MDRIVPGGTLYLSEEDKVLAEQAMKRVLKDTKGQKIIQTDQEEVNMGAPEGRPHSSRSCSHSGLLTYFVRNKKFVAKLNALREANPTCHVQRWLRNLVLNLQWRAVNKEKEKALKMNISKS